MHIKKALLTVFLFNVNFHCVATHHEYATAWIESYVDSPRHGLLLSAPDIQHLANFCYVAYLRSASTIRAQTYALEAMQCTWHGWQNIIHMRLNPSKNLIFTLRDKQTQETIFKNFIDIQYVHYAVSKAYAVFSEECLKKNCISTSAKQALEYVKKQSRPLVAKTCIDIKSVINSLFEYTGSIAGHFETPHNRFSLMDLFWNQISSFAVSPLVEIERATEHAYHTLWLGVTTINTLTTDIWHALETARCSYYQAHYLHLIAVMEKHKFDCQYRTVICPLLPAKNLHNNPPKLPLSLSFKTVDTYLN